MKRFAIFILLAAAIGCGGVQTSKPEKHAAISIPEKVEIIGLSVEGRPMICLTAGNGADRSLLMASIHGNENAGTPLLEELLKRLEANPKLVEGRSVTFLFVTNPDGYVYDQRSNAHGVDLNRNFAATNRENSPRNGETPLSEPESRAIEAYLKRLRPARILSIHQPLETIDYDGPGEEIANAMGQYTWLGVDRIGSRPGSLGSYAGEDLGIPIITMELTRDADNESVENLWKYYGDALMAFVLYPEAPE
ncbi:murein tripeptide amidase MpaA [soil metagenome]